MAPKEKPIANKGSVVPTKHGFRAQMKISRSSTAFGPIRPTRERGTEDLTRMRAALTMEDVARIARELLTLEADSVRERQNEHTQAVGNPSNRSPEVEASPAKRRRIRKKSSVGPEGTPLPRQASIPTMGDGETDVQVPLRGDGQELSLRGLNIQWPFSQLILAGIKTVEVRGYDLRYKYPNVLPGEEVWLIETPGSSKALESAISDRMDMGQSPKRAQIVGTVIFSNAEKYADVNAFRADARRHCIAERGDKDWDGSGDKYAWQVEAVRAVRSPICDPKKTMIGIPNHTSYEVSFISPTPIGENVTPITTVEYASAQASAPDDEWYDCESECEKDGQSDAWQRLSELVDMKDWDGVAAHKALMEEKCRVPVEKQVHSVFGRAAEAEAASPAYFEHQLGAWCGMHALNNYSGGPYITKEDCRAAARNLIAPLSEVGAGDVERLYDHLDDNTGFLSIDVINILGASQLGIHVEGDNISIDQFGKAESVAALVNCNKQHWTVLQTASGSHGWVHSNSICGEGPTSRSAP